MPKYAPLKYKCPKCKKVQKHYTWDNEKDNIYHKCDCGRVLNINNIYKDIPIQLTSIRTETKNR
jgi:phage FluMu protein Com